MDASDEIIWIPHSVLRTYHSSQAVFSMVEKCVFRVFTGFTPDIIVFSHNLVPVNYAFFHNVRGPFSAGTADDLGRL